MAVQTDVAPTKHPAQRFDPALLRRVKSGLLILGLAILLAGGYWLIAQPATISINGQRYEVRLHSRTVGGMLSYLGVNLTPADRVTPPLDAPLGAGNTITIQVARPVIIEADGRVVPHATQRHMVAEVLAEAGVKVVPDDALLIDGRAVSAGASLPTPPSSSSTEQPIRTPRQAVAAARSEPVRLIVRRAVPVIVRDGRLRNTFYTTQPNVGEALLEQGITLFLGDDVTPGLGTHLSPGLRIFIERSVPLTIVADGRSIPTRTRQETVGAALAQAGIPLMGQDFSRPSAEQPIAAHDTIEVVRVREGIEIEQEVIDFETEWVADETLELDQQEIRQAGTMGVIKTRTRVRYENEQEIWREVEDEWLDQAPQDRVVAYGTNVVIRTLETDSGPIEYWRKIPMLVTAYNAANAGKPPDHPRYGITRSGLQAGRGVVAVDTRVVPLMTALYIPKYGQAVAGDTGSSILGKHMDLGYDDDKPLPTIYEWRNVYVLTPVPPASQIRYVLPQWPQR